MSEWEHPDGIEWDGEPEVGCHTLTFSVVLHIDKSYDEDWCEAYLKQAVNEIVDREDGEWADVCHMLTQTAEDPLGEGDTDDPDGCRPECAECQGSCECCQGADR